MSTLTTVEPATAAAVQRRRVLLASLVGSALEWYDFYLYGTAAALVFNKVIFPSFDATASLFASFGTLAVGYFVRPLGGIVFGRLGDLFGRKRVLVLTLLVMGASTVGMALVPTYEQVGVLAPILLVVLRAVKDSARAPSTAGPPSLRRSSPSPESAGCSGRRPASASTSASSWPRARSRWSLSFRRTSSWPGAGVSRSRPASWSSPWPWSSGCG